MDKYGNAAAEDKPPMELLLGQTERQVEYDQAGRIIKGQVCMVPIQYYCLFYGVRSLSQTL